MMGRVARWLRLFGYDTLYFNRADDRDLLFLALVERRVLLTRDVELARTAGACAYLVRGNDLWSQLREICDHFGIQPRVVLKRCPVCNGEVVPVEKSSVEGEVPRYTFLTHDQFWRCANCGKIYWRGTHIQLARRDIIEKLGGTDEDKPNSSVGEPDN